MELARILVSGSDAYGELGTNPLSAGALVTAAPAPAQEEAWPKNVGRARPEGWTGVGVPALSLPARPFPSLLLAVFPNSGAALSASCPPGSLGSGDFPPYSWASEDDTNPQLGLSGKRE